MCARVTILTFEEIRQVVDDLESRKASRLALQTAPESGRAQAYPGSALEAIVQPEGATHLDLRPLTWGMEAPWAKEGAPAKLVFNTRLESALAGSGMWARPIAHGRCILPAATFFEPHATQTCISPRSGKPVKRPYEFRMASGEPLLLASVHDGSRLSVVTTEPNANVRTIHPRMPLALRFEEAPLWLEGDLHDIAALADRSGLELAAAPEHPDWPENAQLSLF